MDLFAKLAAAPGVTVLHGATIDCAREGGTDVLSVAPAKLARQMRPSDYVLLATHYTTSILARFPREDNDLDRYGMELRQVVADIVNQGVWPGSDLIADAQLKEQMRLDQPGGSTGVSQVAIVLMRSLASDDLDVAVEVPPTVSHETLVRTVPAMLQSVVTTAAEPEIELLDRCLRYLMTHIGEGAHYGDPAAARSLANSAFREAGGEAV